MNISATEWLALGLSAVVLWAAGKVIVTCYRGGYDDLEDIKYVVLDGYEEDLWEERPPDDKLDREREIEDRGRDVIQ